MTNQEITDIIKKIDRANGQYPVHIDDTTNTVVYVIKNENENSCYITDYSKENVTFDKAVIESLVALALSAKKASSIRAKATHYVCIDRCDDYSSTSSQVPPTYKEILLELSLDLTNEKPLLSVRELPFSQYLDHMPAL
jgi:hypothetical protein